MRARVRGVCLALWVSSSRICVMFAHVSIVFLLYSRLPSSCWRVRQQSALLRLPNVPSHSTSAACQHKKRVQGPCGSVLFETMPLLP